MSVIKTETAILPVRPYRLVGDPDTTTEADLILSDTDEAEWLDLEIKFKSPNPQSSDIKDSGSHIAQAWWEDLIHLQTAAKITHRRFVLSIPLDPSSMLELHVKVPRSFGSNKWTLSDLVEIVKKETLLEMSYEQRLHYRHNGRYFASPSTFKRIHCVRSEDVTLTSSLEYLRGEGSPTRDDRLAIQFTTQSGFKSKLIAYFYSWALAFPLHSIPESDYILVRYDKNGRYIQCVTDPSTDGSRHPAFNQLAHAKSSLARVEPLSSALFEFLVREYKSGCENFYHRPSCPLYRVSDTEQ